MRTIEINFGDRDRLPAVLEILAKESSITVEQLVKRFIAEGISSREANELPAFPGETLDDFLVKNGVLSAKNAGCAQKGKK